MTSLETGLDPALARLAEAVLIPPFPGIQAPRWVLDALGRGLAGVTLFGPNVLGDTAALTSSLRSAAASEPVIAIDEEGGDVTRVAYADGSPYPGNAALGAVDDVALTRQVYTAIGSDLAALGINLDLAPCADVLGPGDTPAVGTRSFAAATDLVARHTAAAVRGLQSAGVAACAKHFPGHGSTETDSHHAIATITGTLDDVRRRDLPPFTAAIHAGAAAVMPGHLRVPELTGDRPATLSAAAIGLLRGELGFTGVVISDALEMKATSDAYGIPDAAVLALAAGVDLLCFGRDTDESVYLSIRAAIVSAVAEEMLPGERLEEAADRVAGLRARIGRGPGAGSVPGAGGLGDGDGPVPVPPGIGLAAARRALRMSGTVPPLADPLIIEVEPRENVAAGEFGWGLGPWAPVRRVASVNPRTVLADAAGRTLIVVIRDAIHARELLTVLAARPDAILVDMGVPLWAPPPGITYLATYGASRASAQAAAELLGLA